MTLGDMDLQHLQLGEHATMRQIEQKIYKNNAKSAVDLNKACVLNFLLPKYIHLYILID